MSICCQVMKELRGVGVAVIKLAQGEDHMSQDPLEKCQRQRGETHDNPSVQEFCKNTTQALRVINAFCRGPVKGNCRTLKRPADLEKETFRFQNGEESNKDGSTSVYLHCAS